MGKASKARGAAASRDWGSGGEWRFGLIQPIEVTPVKSGIIRIAGSPDRRIAGSPDRRIAGSPDRRIAGSPDRRIAGSPDRRIAGSPDRRIAGILAALHLLPRGGESSAPFAGRRTARSGCHPHGSGQLVVMAATLTAQV